MYFLVVIGITVNRYRMNKMIRVIIVVYA